MNINIRAMWPRGHPVLYWSVLASFHFRAHLSWRARHVRYGKRDKKVAL